jgi:NAD(P)-dependent dehydrogenase (short-subunit alcohol dehydrogenase family)
MTTVAVAGGTGGIGKTLVEELVREGRHNVLVLSRGVFYPNIVTLTTSN